MKKVIWIAALCLSTSMAFSQNLINVAGNGTIWSSGSTGENGPATSAKLYGVEGVAVDAFGNIFIADASADLIRRVDAVTKLITTVAGKNITPGYLGDEGPAVNALLNRPMYLCFDYSGNLYVSDGGNNVIRKITAMNGKITSTNNCIISTIAGNGTYPPSPNNPNSCGDGGPAVAAQIKNPTGVAIENGGNLFISDALGCIRKVTAVNGQITSTNGCVISTIIGDPMHVNLGLAGNNVPASASLLHLPTGLSFDGWGNLYVVDGYYATVSKITANSGRITSTNGCLVTNFAGVGGQGGFNGDGIPATTATLFDPQGIAVSPANGNVYISDYTNNRIRVVNISTNMITTLAGNGSYYEANNYYNTSGGLSPLNSSIRPYQIAIDQCGSIYAVDESNACIIEIPSGSVPVYTPSVSASSVCAGSNIVATGTSGSAIAPDDYYWTLLSCNASGQADGIYNSGGFSTGNSNTYSFPYSSAMPCDHNYLVQMTITKTCPQLVITTAYKQVYMNCPPTPTIGGITNICLGNSTTLYGNYPNTAPYSMSWNIIAKSGTHTQNVTVTPSGNTTYVYTVTNNTTGCTASASQLVTVQNIQPNFTLAQNFNTAQNTLSAVATNYVYLPSDPSFHSFWKVEEVPVGAIYPYTAIAQTEVDNNSCWPVTGGPVGFNGYVGGVLYPSTSTTFPSCANPATFPKGREYLITFTTSSNTCATKSAYGVAYQCPTCKYESATVNSSPDPGLALGIVNANELQAEVNLYPNPSTGDFTIESNETSPQFVQVFDLTGRVVLKQTINGKASINGNDLANGVYTVKITGAAGTANKKIVIAR